MATITSDTFLDGGTARTAGEAWTFNGGSLTVRTDTRWHANAPAGMLGSIGSTAGSATLGGGILLDGRNVREITFNSGSGTVPAIGTTITQGAVSGYLLAVYANLQSAPTAVGAAMPSTGWIKFREVTGGTFSAGALTGISASSDGADVVSWIEVVQDQAVANTVNRLNFFRTRGNWYQLGTTNGTPGQNFQVPTNGGGSGTEVPAIFIETAVGSNVYEPYPTVLPANFIAGNFGTDARSKVAENRGTGQVRIGNNGTVNVGFTPPSGLKVVVPNVFGRQTSAANRALNLIPSGTLATRPDFTTTAAGVIDFEYFMNDWYHLFASPNNVYISNSATFDIHSTSNEAQPTIIDNFCTGPRISTTPLTLLNNPNGGTISNSKFLKYDAATNGHSCSITLCSNYDFDNCHFGIMQYARSSGNAITMSQVTDCTFNDTYLFAGAFAPSTCSNLTITNTDYVDRWVGNTNTTTGKVCISLAASCTNILVDGITLGLKGLITANFVNPYLQLVLVNACSNVTIRNAGTLAAPLQCENATNAIQQLFSDSGVNNGITVKRLYSNFVRTAPYVSTNTSKNITIENVSAQIGAMTYNSLDSSFKGIRAASAQTTGQSSVYGSHVTDIFNSNTQGNVLFVANEPTAKTLSTVTLTLAGSTGGFTSTGSCSMPTVGDRLIIEMPYFAIAHTAFRNLAPLISATIAARFDFEYDLDTGSGFSGTFKLLTAANLTGETISPSVGFRLKLRVTTNTANTANVFTSAVIYTDSTLTAQTDNLYVLNTARVQLNGLVSGSRVQLYNVDSNTELYNAVVASTSLTVDLPFTSAFDLRTRVMYATDTTARIFYEQTDEVTSLGLTKNIVQEIDTVYVNNGVDGFTVSGIDIVDSTFLVEIDSTTLPIPNVYAYCVAWLFSEEGIRDEGQFIEALDQANYLVSEFSIKNVSSPSVPLTLTNGWIRSATTGTTAAIIDNSGGSIFSNPDLVIPFSSGSGLSPAQDATLSKLDTLTENVSGLRFTEKALEQAPSGGGGGSAPTEAEMYTFFTSSGRQDAFKATGFATPTNVSDAQTAIISQVNTRLPTASYTAPPSAAANATAVRSELTTELARIDVATSTRLSSAGYTAPANSDIAAIKAKTDTLVNTDLSTVAKTSELEVVNENVKKASLLVPASEDI